MSVEIAMVSLLLTMNILKKQIHLVIKQSRKFCLLKANSLHKSSTFFSNFEQVFAYWANTSQLTFKIFSGEFVASLLAIFESFRIIAQTDNNFFSLVRISSFEFSSIRFTTLNK